MPRNLYARHASRKGPSWRTNLPSYSPASIARKSGISLKSAKSILSGRTPARADYLKVYNFVRRENYRALRRSLPSATSRELHSASTLGKKAKGVYSSVRKILQHDEARRVVAFSPDQRARYMYMRRHGVNIDQAKEMRIASWTDVKDLSGSVLSVARKLAKGNRIPLSVILRGLRFSGRMDSDWEEYLAMRRRQGWRPVHRVYNKKKQTYEYKMVSKRSKTYEEWKRRG